VPRTEIERVVSEMQAKFKDHPDVVYEVEDYRGHYGLRCQFVSDATGNVVSMMVYPRYMSSASQLAQVVKCLETE